jgi:pilus assembly protein Flp/PilA
MLPPFAAKRRAAPMNASLIFACLIKDEAGATAIEYGLICALIALAIVGVWTTVGTNLSMTFSTVAANL